LGIGLRHITSLSLSFCGLNDLDGIGVLTGLQEICLSDNFITDVAPLAMHENLQVLFIT
jgi:Leucine-rich repeat (LRR) protein